MKRKLNILIFIVILLGVLVVFKIFSTIKLESINDLDNIAIRVEISKITKRITVYEIKYCKEKNCENVKIHTSIKLTKDEYEKVVKIIKQDEYNSKQLVEALNTLVKDDNVMFNKNDEYYEIKEDLNQDGDITYREYANIYLDNLIIE